jgi:hypothetical protein
VKLRGSATLYGLHQTDREGPRRLPFVEPSPALPNRKNADLPAIAMLLQPRQFVIDDYTPSGAVCRLAYPLRSAVGAIAMMTLPSSVMNSRRLIQLPRRRVFANTVGIHCTPAIVDLHVAAESISRGPLGIPVREARGGPRRC